MAITKNSIVILFSLILVACGGETTSDIETLPTITAIIKPNFNINKHSAPVLSSSAANASGQFTHPFNNETFTGNLLAAIEVDDPDGIAAVGISFNQQNSIKYLCNTNVSCQGTHFSTTETNINPASYNIYNGPVTLNLWVVDINQQQMLVDSVTLNWQYRKIDLLQAQRNDNGDQITLSWQGQNELIKYNIYKASAPNVSQQSYQSLPDGEAKLALAQTNFTFTQLSANKSYYFLITGVDGSGESAFSSEIRLDPYTGKVNTAPIASNDIISGIEDQPVQGNLLNNDRDNDNNILTVNPIPTRSPFFGKVAIQQNGDFTYTPNENFSGTDSFNYEIQDGQGGFSQAQALITITATNDAPQARDDTYSVNKNQTLTIVAPGVLNNDTDQDNDILTVATTPIADVTHGNLTLNSDGSFTYQPNTDFIGRDTFTYQISDNKGGSASANVSIDITDTNTNTPPIAVNDSYSTLQNTSLVVDGTNLKGVLDNDSDADGDSLQLSNTLIQNVTNGTLTISNDGLFTYIPNTNFIGNDAFIYQVIDGNGGSAQATVTINVTTVNQAPIAIDDSYTIDQDTTLNVDNSTILGLLSNDSDPENDTLTVNTTPISNVTNGVLTLNNDGTFTYVPNTGYIGNDTFEYEINDGNNNTASALVTITINKVNTTPIAKPDDYTLAPDTTINVDNTTLAAPLINDTDADGDTLNYTGNVNTVENGTLNISNDSTFSYVPSASFTGVDSFHYSISDNNGGDTSALVTLTVSKLSFDLTNALPNIVTANYQGISYDGSRYYLVANGNILTSSNLTTWDNHFHSPNTPLLAVASGQTSTAKNLLTSVAVGIASNVLIAQTENTLGTWVKRNVGTNYAMQNIILSNNEFIATGQQNILFSPDGINWNAHTTNNAVMFNSVIRFNNQIIAVGDNGVIETSPTGTTWTTQTSTVNTKLTDITANNNLLVSVGFAGTVLTSSDGITWVKQISNTTGNLKAIAYGNNMFMAVGDNNTVITSVDGTTWTIQSNIDSQPMNDVIYDGKQFIIVADQANLFTSTDGVNFQPINIGDNRNFTAIATNGSSLIRAGNNTEIYKSVDGINWVQIINSQLPAQFIINKIIYANNNYIAVGNNGLILTSSNGDNWIEQNSQVSDNINNVMMHSGVDVQGSPFTLYVAVGDNGLLLTSNDAINWQREVMSQGTIISENLYGIAHDNDYFVAVGKNGKIIVRNNTSTPSATTWMDFFSNTAYGTLNDIIYDGTTNIIVGNNGVIVTGTAQGGNFSQLGASISNNLHSISFSAGKYIIGGDLGSLFTSNDGINWLRERQASTQTINSIIINNNKIYAVGDFGTYFSADYN